MGETRREASIGCIARSCLRNKIKQLQKQNKTSTGFLPLLVLFDDDQDVSARAGCKKPSLPKWGDSFRLPTYITMGLVLFFCSLPFPRKSTRKMQRSPCRITRLSWTLPKCKESGRTRRTSALWVSIPLRPSPLMGAGQQAKGWLWGHTLGIPWGQRSVWIFSGLTLCFNPKWASKSQLLNRWLFVTECKLLLSSFTVDVSFSN